MTRSWQVLRKADQHLKAAKAASEALVALHEIRFIDHSVGSSYEVDVKQNIEKLQATKKFLSTLKRFLSSALEEREGTELSQEGDYGLRRIVESLKEHYVTAEERDLVDVVERAIRELEAFIQSHHTADANTAELERLLEAIADTSMEKHERAMMLAAAHQWG